MCLPYGVNSTLWQIKAMPGTSFFFFLNLNRVMRKPAFCKYMYENKDADQLRGTREADQRLCFHNIDSTMPLLSNSEISSL